MSLMLSAKAILTSLAVHTSDLPNLSWIQLSAEAAGWAPKSSPPSAKAPRNRLHIPSLAHFLFVLHIYFLLPFFARVLASMISRGAVLKRSWPRTHHGTQAFASDRVCTGNPRSQQLDFGLIGLWSNSRDEFLNGFERDASVRPRSFIGKTTDEENHFVRGLFGIQRLTTERLCLVRGSRSLHRLCYSGGYSEPSSPHSRAGRSVDGTMQIRHKKTL